MATSRERRLTVAENDVRVLDAAVAVLDQFGLDGTNARRVAEAAGLSTGAVYGRFENIDELMVEVWQRRVRSVIRAGLGRAVGFSDPVDGVVPVGVPEEFDEVLEHIGALFFALAPRNEVLFEVMAPDVNAWLLELGLGPEHPMPRRANRALAVATYLGAMLHASVSEAMNPDWGMCLGWWARAQGATVGPRSAIRPSGVGPELSVSTGDADLDRLLAATAEVIARAGVSGTTLTRIARRAGLPRSAVYSHFDSRDELVQACVFHSTVNPQSNHRRLLTMSSTDGFAESLAQSMGPAARVWRRQRLESMLAAVSDTRLASSLLRAGLEAESEVALLAGATSLDSEYAIRQLLRFYDVIVTGACTLPELSDALADLDWRHSVSPFNELVAHGILGIGSPASTERSAG